VIKSAKVEIELKKPASELQKVTLERHLNGVGVIIKLEQKSLYLSAEQIESFCESIRFLARS